MAVNNLDLLLEQVHEALAANNDDGLRALLSVQHPANIADVLERVNEEDRLKIFKAVASRQAALVLSEMGAYTTRELVEDMSAEEIGDLLDQLPVDEAAEILSEDVPELQQELLQAMEPQEAAEVREALQYPPNSAGRLMTERFVRVRPEMTPAQAIEHIRKVDADCATINDLYVLDKGGHLIGVLSLREIITASPTKRLEELMVRDIISVSPETDQEEVAEQVSRYDFLAMPVVDDQNKLLGIVTVDDVIDVLVQEQSEDALRFAGVEGGGSLDQPYFTVPMLQVIRKRFGWLLLLFVAETFTGSVLRVFESELAQVVALSFFIPLLIGTGGNTGAQTVSTIIRGIALKEIRLRDAGRVIWRELGSGLMLGSLLGAAGFLRALVWGSSPSFSFVIGISVLVICTWANTIGSLIPLVAHRLKIDPAIVSAPLITTLVDATGLAIYLLIAKAVLGI